MRLRQPGRLCKFDQSIYADSGPPKVSRVHIYHAPIQPLVKYTCNLVDPPLEFTTPYRNVYTCGRCYRRRQARNLSIQVYYDATYIFCDSTVRRRSDTFPFEYGNFCPLK